MYQNLTQHKLDESNVFWTGFLPAQLQMNSYEFEKLWSLHPEDFHEIKIHGRSVKTPRWQ
jgi:hypothetical protein